MMLIILKVWGYIHVYTVYITLDIIYKIIYITLNIYVYIYIRVVLISKFVPNETGTPLKGSKLIEMKPPKISF